MDVCEWLAVRPGKASSISGDWWPIYYVSELITQQLPNYQTKLVQTN